MILTDNLLRQLGIVLKYPGIVMGQHQQHPLNTPAHQFVKGILTELEPLKNAFQIIRIHN